MIPARAAAVRNISSAAENNFLRGLMVPFYFAANKGVLLG